MPAQHLGASIVKVSESEHVQRFHSMASALRPRPWRWARIRGEARQRAVGTRDVGICAINEAECPYGGPPGESSNAFFIQHVIRHRRRHPACLEARSFGPCRCCRVHVRVFTFFTLRCTSSLISSSALFSSAVGSHTRLVQSLLLTGAGCSQLFIRSMRGTVGVGISSSIHVSWLTEHHGALHRRLGAPQRHRRWEIGVFLRSLGPRPPGRARQRSLA